MRAEAGALGRTARGHVLVARLDNLGDVVLAGPAIRAVAASAGRVTLLTSSQGAAVAPFLPGVDDLLVFDAPWIRDPAPPVGPEVSELVEAVAARCVDAAVIFSSLHQSPLPLALLLRQAGIGRVGAVADEYPGSLVDVRVRTPGHVVHEVQRNLMLAAECGFTLPPGDGGRPALRGVPRGLPVPGIVPGVPYVVVHPGASVPARTWEPGRWAEAVRALRREGWSVVVTGGPGERELTGATASAGGPGVVDLGGGTDLAGMLSVIASASVVVVGNSGPAHLAAALGTPVCSVFPPTVPVGRWGPYGVACEVLGRQDIACRGCRARRCPQPVHRCVAGIGTAEVVDAVRRLSSVSSGRPRPVVERFSPETNRFDAGVPAGVVV